MCGRWHPDSLHPGVRDVFERAVSGLESLGAACEEVSLEMVDYSVAAYYTITSTEAGSNLARYDNIRYGYGLDREGYEFHRYVTASRDRFGPEVKRRIIAGGFVPSAGYAGRYFLKALKVKSRLTREVNRLFDTYDYLASPTVPVPPFRLGERLDDPVGLFQLDINTVTANLTGKPAVSVPCGTCDDLPVGVQLMADSFRDGPLWAPPGSWRELYHDRPGNTLPADRPQLQALLPLPGQTTGAWSPTPTSAPYAWGSPARCRC